MKRYSLDGCEDCVTSEEDPEGEWVCFGDVVPLAAERDQALKDIAIIQHTARELDTALQTAWEQRDALVAALKAIDKGMRSSRPMSPDAVCAIARAALAAFGGET